MTDSENVKVFCRVRPLNSREIEHRVNQQRCITVPVEEKPKTLFVSSQKHHLSIAKPFTFDQVFHENSSQSEIFDTVGKPLTTACLEGYNGTIFAYGQTGSGKTFTMLGSEQSPSLQGLVPRVFDFLFEKQNSNKMSDIEYKYSCSFLEIYNERVYDLLDGRASAATSLQGLTLRESANTGVVVDGLVELQVKNATEAAEMMSIGVQNRHVGETAMNRESSRSHSVFILQIISTQQINGLTKTRISRFNLIDLAGSERQKSTEALGDRLKEAGSINKSLSALGNVIMALVDQAAGKVRHSKFLYSILDLESYS